MATSSSFSASHQGDMLKQAQHIWTMLDELADSDPEAYKKFIEKNARESKEIMAPAKPYMCIQTKILRPKTHELFINVCSWTRVPKPKTSEDPISLSGGPLEEDIEGKGSYKVIRLGINPYVLDECCKRQEEKAMLIQLGLKYLEHQHNVGISRCYTILEDIKYKGDSSVLLKNFFLKKDDEERKSVDDFLSDISNMSPDSLLTQLGKISTDDVEKDNDINSNGSSKTPRISLSGSDSEPSKPGLIEEISSSDAKLEIPKHEVCLKDADDKRARRLIVKVSLPQVTSVKGCELDITEDEISLRAANTYELHLSLPERIDESKASAKFSSKASSLTITLPTLSQP